ncbi:hypothetical protein Tco_1497843, partial [Tanacetum coccineum]
VHGGNYSSTEQVNLIQQLFAYCLFTGIKVDKGEIIYNDLVTRLTNKSRQNSPTILGNSNFSKDPSKVIPIELTAFIIAVNNNEKFVNPLPFTIKKRKGKPQTMTSTLPQSQGFEASGSLPQKRKMHKSKKPPTETKPADKGLPSTAFDDGMVKTTLLPKGPRGDKNSEGLKPLADMELQTNHESNNEEVFVAREEIDEYISPTDESASDSSSPKLKKYDNIMLLTERQLTDKLVQSIMDCLDKNSTERAELLKALNRVTETLKVVQEAVKDDPALNKKVIEATEAYKKNSTSLV